jgi:GT2 family glycosyltransferase
VENLTIVIPFYNGHRHIDRLLESLPVDLPVLVVDDMSDEPLQLKRPNVQVIRLKVKGYFTGAVNAGMAACETDALILNQDVWFEGARWLDLLHENRDKYATIGEGIAGNHPAWPRGYIHGTFMFIRRDAWDTVGPMNEIDYPLWGSTCEWQLRACRKDYKALPIGQGYVPGFYHARTGNYGEAITEMLGRHPEQRKWFIRTPPAISVVISCFNYGRFLRDAVNSLIGGPNSLSALIGEEGQTFQSFEVIIVDDGSADTTEKVGKELADPWKGVRYVRRASTGGTPAANNTGIRRAHAPVISMLCADDMMSPTRLERMYRALEDNPHSMIYDDLRHFADGQWNRYRKTGQTGLSSIQRMMHPYDFDRLLEKNGIHSGIMFPKQAWVDIGGYDERMRWGREDWQVNVALGAKGYCGVRVDEALYLYRREGQNRTLRNTTPHHRQQFGLQMQEIFPMLYRGVRMAGCCGGRASKSNSRSRTTAPTRPVGGRMDIGEEGLVKLKYVGRSAGRMTYYGQSTRARYSFGGRHIFGYVDKRDVEHLLRIKEHGRSIFQRVDERPPKKAREDEFVPPSEPVEELLPQPPLEEDIVLPFDPNDHLVKEMQELLDSISLHRAEVLEELLALELAGKSRIRVASMIRAAIEKEKIAVA